VPGLWAGLLLGGAALGCGPTFPPAWLLEAEPTEAGGRIDPDGKLRVLAMVSEPPEATPGQLVSLSALLVTHPRFGEVTMEGGRAVTTLRPRGLTVLYRQCLLPESVASPLPCGLSSQTAQYSELPVVGDFATELRIPESFGSPYVILVTLIAADQAYPGGATACAQDAAQNGGLSPLPNHCVVAVKRVKVSQSTAPNHNPKLQRILVGADDASLVDAESAAASYPKLSAEVADADRPKWQVVADRAADAEEQEPDPRDPSRLRAELLSTSVFVTAGTLEAGRGSFLDLGCSGDCPQLLRSPIGWQPPAATASLEAPDDRIHFVVVLRDDRGGVSFKKGTAQAR